MTRHTRRGFIGTAVGGVAGSIAAAPALAEAAAVTVHEDVTYRTTEDGPLSADVYVPPGEGPHPTLVWVHGGGWTKYSKDRLSRKARDFARQGYAGVSIDYRLAPEHTYPDPVVDTAAASQWVAGAAGRFGFDPDRIGYVGRSAGAHLAALAAVTGLSRTETVVGFYGPYDLRPLIREGMSDPAVAAFLGGPASENPGTAVAASPAVHVTPDDPPHLLLHGTADERVPYRSSVAYKRALEAAGVRADLFTARGAGHEFDRRRRWYGQTRGVLTDYLEDVLR